MNRRRALATLTSVVGVVGWAAAVFSAAVALLLAATLLQLRSTDPLNAPSLLRLREAALRHPEVPELAEDVRALDLLARRAFFISLHQMRQASRLLVGGVLVALLAFHLRKHLAPPSPRPSKGGVPGDFDARRRPEQRAVAAAGVGVAVAALGLSWWAARVGAPLPRSGPFRGSPPSVPTRGIPESLQPVPSLVRPDRVWPGFRGIEGTGVAVATNVPVHWDGTRGLGIRWRVAVPRPGVSSPIVWEEEIWVTGADQAGREVCAYRLSDGALLWRASVGALPGTPDRLPEVSEETGWAAPTPVTDGVRIYALFGNGDLVALDRSGRLVWGRNLGVPMNPYGHASSLRVHGDLLFVQYDQTEGGFLLAVDGGTGRERWRRDRPAISWASPICVATGTRTELILADSRAVRSYDPRTGLELWGVECLSGEVAPSPAYREGLVIVANEYATACALRVGEGGVQKVWEYDEVLPAVASPLHTGTHVFLAASDGRVACLDAQEGRELWQHEFRAGFYASPLAVAGRVYLLDREGNTHVVSDATRFEKIAESPLGEPAVATPAVVDGVLVIRGQHHLFCVEGAWPRETSSP